MRMLVWQIKEFKYITCDGCFFKDQGNNSSLCITTFWLISFFSCILSETFSLNFPASKDCSFETPPTFSVPLKTHNSPESYECYMSCAVTGNPRPHVTWYRNNISLNTNTNYYITNTCGVCSMVILKVGPKDSGDYTVIAENSLGRVECSTKLVVKGKNTFQIMSYLEFYSSGYMLYLLPFLSLSD